MISKGLFFLMFIITKERKDARAVWAEISKPAVTKKLISVRNCFYPEISHLLWLNKRWISLLDTSNIKDIAHSTEDRDLWEYVMDLMHQM